MPGHALDLQETGNSCALGRVGDAHLRDHALAKWVVLRPVERFSARRGRPRWPGDSPPRCSAQILLFTTRSAGRRCPAQPGTLSSASFPKTEQQGRLDLFCVFLPPRGVPGPRRAAIASSSKRCAIAPARASSARSSGTAVGCTFRIPTAGRQKAETARNNLRDVRGGHGRNPRDGSGA